MRIIQAFILVSFTLLQLAFDFSTHSIPLEEIYGGGPPKDGIPALFDPEFIPGRQAAFLKPGDRILGLEVNGQAKAYPIQILTWHELVNDKIGGQSVLVSYCPLCGTGMAFDAIVNGRRELFGVSGKLYNSNVLFYDKGTESLWSQIRMEAVTGPLTGTRLIQIPLDLTTWKVWSDRYPDTLVLSRNTGHRRRYGVSPYKDYER